MQTVTSHVNQLSAEKMTLESQINAPDEVPAMDLFLQAVENYRSGFQTTEDVDKKRSLISALIERITIVHQTVEVHWRI